jgi:hypothetical protein
MGKTRLALSQRFHVLLRVKVSRSKSVSSSNRKCGNQKILVQSSQNVFTVEEGLTQNRARKNVFTVEEGLTQNRAREPVYGLCSATAAYEPVKPGFYHRIHMQQST